MNPDDHHPARTREDDNMFESKFDFKDIKFPIKIRDIHEIEKKKTCTGTSIFGYENKEKYLLYVSQNSFKKH